MLFEFNNWPHIQNLGVDSEVVVLNDVPVTMCELCCIIQNELVVQQVQLSNCIVYGFYGKIKLQ